MEIVTEPDIRSPAQARAYGETLRDILRHIGASDGDMETGSMRIEGNISLRPMGTSGFGTKVEVKNLNSFRSLEHAMEFEAERHAEALDRGESLLETRGWDENAGRTISQRSKEEANDYRYFPEPDLPPLRPSHDWIAEIREAMPELPAATANGYEQALGCPPTTPGCSRRTWRWPITSIGWWRRDRAQVGRQLGDRRVQPPAEPARRGGLRASDVALSPEGLAS